jgi:L-seryl-tRNA(Ser) seleniumtransferase
MATQKGAKRSSSDRQMNLLREIPKVDECIAWLQGKVKAPGLIVKSAIREVLEECRQAILRKDIAAEKNLTKSILLIKFQERIDSKMAPNLKRIINASGVVIHTNLGRSILPKQTAQFVSEAACRYSNLEFDLHSGQRGSRYSLVEELICQLTGAEAALVVNNNAAAVLLVLDTLAKGKEVIVSRGQLVEIGGSFRIPDVMAKSGSCLVEVGATNRTHLYDYENAITEETVMLLKVHASNFKVIGFTSEVSPDDLVSLAEKNDLIVMEDLGSGSMVDFSQYGMIKEPTIQEVVRSGVHVITFSGDKLLGGPQAGIIIGKKELIDRIKKNQLNRALRIDKLTLAALESVLRLYFDEREAIRSIPTLSMLTMTVDQIRKKAQRLARRIKDRLSGKCKVETHQVISRVGGGSLPEQELTSCAVVLSPAERTINELEEILRKSIVPVIGRIENDSLILDMRTVDDDEIPQLATILFSAFGVEE